MKTRVLNQTSYPALVGWVIKSLRLENDLKQSDFAKEIGVPPSSWSKYESGQSALTVAQLNQAAFLLGQKPQAILERVEQLQQAIIAGGIVVTSGLEIPNSKRGKPISGRALAAVITNVLLNGTGQ